MKHSKSGRRSGSSGKAGTGNLVPTRFEFNVHITEVRPWLQMKEPAVIQWQRGDKRTGFSRPVLPEKVEKDGKESFVIPIDQAFRVPVTLYREKGIGPYQKKSLTFSLHEAVSETDPQPKPSPLGKATLDMAEFADREGTTDKSVKLTTSTKLVAQIGQPMMRVSVQFLSKKTSKSKGGGGGGGEGGGDLYNDSAAFDRPFPTKLEPFLTDNEEAISSGDEDNLSEDMGGGGEGGGERGRRGERRGKFGSFRRLGHGQGQGHASGALSADETDGERDGNASDYGARSDYGGHQSDYGGATSDYGGQGSDQGGSASDQSDTRRGGGSWKSANSSQASSPKREKHVPPSHHNAGSGPLDLSEAYAKMAADQAPPQPLGLPPSPPGPPEISPDRAPPQLLQKPVGRFSRKQESEETYEEDEDETDSTAGTGPVQQSSRPPRNPQDSRSHRNSSTSPPSRPPHGRPSISISPPLGQRPGISATRQSKSFHGTVGGQGEGWGSGGEGEGVGANGDMGDALSPQGQSSSKEEDSRFRRVKSTPTGFSGPSRSPRWMPKKGANLQDTGGKSLSFRQAGEEEEEEEDEVYGEGEELEESFRLRERRLYGDVGGLRGFVEDEVMTYTVPLEKPLGARDGALPSHSRSSSFGRSPKSSSGTSLLEERMSDFGGAEEREGDLMIGDVIGGGGGEEREFMGNAKEGVVLMSGAMGSGEMVGGDLNASRLELDWKVLRKEQQAVAEEKRILAEMEQEVERNREWAEKEGARVKEEKMQIEYEKKRLSDAEIRLQQFREWTEEEKGRIQEEKKEAELVRQAAEEMEEEAEVMREKLEEAGRSLEEEKAKLAEVTASVAEALARAAEAEDRARNAERKFGRLPGDLRDSALAEVAVYSILPVHGGPAHKIHTPARRFARALAFAMRHEGDERAAGVAYTAIAALTLATRSSVDDPGRILFWWTNTAMLREAISLVVNPNNDATPSFSSPTSSSNIFSLHSPRTPISPLSPQSFGSFDLSSDPSHAAAKPEGQAGAEPGSGGRRASLGQAGWSDAGFFISALRRLEEWQFTRCVNAVWKKLLLPAMQRHAPPAPPKSPMDPKTERLRLLSPKLNLNPSPQQLGTVKDPERDHWWMRLSGVERWRGVLEEASILLCPMRGTGQPCGCCYSLHKQVLEQLMARMDVALFNALLRPNSDLSPSDSLADPLSDPEALPFVSFGRLTFGHGLHLKFAVSAWSQVLHDMDIRMQAETQQEMATLLRSSQSQAGASSTPPLSDAASLEPPRVVVPAGGGQWGGGGSSEGGQVGGGLEKIEKEGEEKFDLGAYEDGGGQEAFPLLKSMAQLLLLPKDLILDKDVRDEVCGPLSIASIRQIVQNFVPDSNAPEPVSSSLLEALSQEMQKQAKQRQWGRLSELAPAAKQVYHPPSSATLRKLLGSPGALFSNSSWSFTFVLDRGYGSDEDLKAAENPLEMVIESQKVQGQSGSGGRKLTVKKDNPKAPGYKLLAEIWNNVESPFTSIDL